MRRLGLLAASLLLACSVIGSQGCGLLGHGKLHQQQPAEENPLRVPAMDREFLWSQVVDAVDDYFKIEREERIRVLGDVVSEGRIETFPEVGAGYLEPWRRDSTPGFQRLHSTLQSVRRRAVVRVSPAPDGYAIHVAVLKELEDVSRPEHATVGGATLRHDGTVVRTNSRVGPKAVTLGWIPQGRDFSLEQQMLIEIQARLANSAPPRGLLHH